jgi:serine/threonine protein phosphatase PrpC
MKIDVFGLTDVGKKRKINEDNFQCAILSEKNMDKGVPASLLIVADGIGGHAGGDTASAMAVNILTERIRSQYGVGNEAKVQRHISEGCRGSKPYWDGNNSSHCVYYRFFSFDLQCRGQPRLFDP